MLLKRIAVLCAAILGLSASIASAQNDGNMWLRLRSAGDIGDTARLTYAAGIIDGMVLSASRTAFSGGDIKEGLERFDQTWKAISGVRPSQLRDGLDVFFDDFRNRSIAIKDGAWIALEQIAGHSAAEVEKEIEDLRRLAKK